MSKLNKKVKLVVVDDILIDMDAQVDLVKNFSELSINLTNTISNDIIKKEGIYFTPNSIIQNNINIIKHFCEQNNIIIQEVLEPSCGSCEYINILDKHFSGINIMGIELNTQIFSSISNLVFNNDVSLINHDFLTINITKKFDLIIGNPPYFVINKANILKKYKQYFDGRPNIYIIFILKCLELLNDNGILSFILPLNFINCLYYNKIRQHIYNNYKILTIINCSDDDFLETKQETIIFMIQKIADIEENNKFTLQINDYIIFNTPDKIIQLHNLYANSTSLNALGFSVNVGTIVWNQCKDILTDNDDDTQLIYSSDILNQTLVKKKYKDISKKNYIKKKGNTNPLLVINRGYGKGKYKLDYCLININREYLIENHLICINYESHTNADNLLDMYEKIMLSLNNKKTLDFINLYFGNNAINCTEMRNILPIYWNV